MIAQLQADNTRTTGVYNFVVDGKPAPDAVLVAQLEKILRAAGIELSEGRSAPPEFWRSIVAKATRHRQDPRVLWDVKVTPRFAAVYAALDVGLMDEDDRILLLELTDAAREGRTQITLPAGKEPLAHTLCDALLAHVRECDVSVQGSTIKLTPVLTTGRVQIAKSKLAGLKVEAATKWAYNPRLARIQAATMLARPEDLLREARRGAAHPKDDADKPQERKIECRCPTVDHRDDKPSAWVEMYDDGLGGGCSGCKGFGSNYPGLISAGHPRLTWDEACAYAEAVLGLTPWGEVPEGQRVVGDEITTIAGLEMQPEATEATQEVEEAAEVAEATQEPTEATGSVPQTPEVESKTKTTAEPPAAPFAAWLKRQSRIGPAEVAWLQSRKLDPVVLARRVIMWAATKSTAQWDGITFDESYLDEWGTLCAKAHTLLFPTVDHTGQVVGVRARLTVGDSPIKTRTPSLKVGRESRGIPQRGALACVRALRALQKLDPWPAIVVVTEGEPDFLTACQLYPDAAVLGMYAAEASWTPEIADQIPDGTKVYILTDPDGRGNAYRRRVIRPLRGRCRVWRLGGRRDLNDLHTRSADIEDHIVEAHPGPLGLHGADNAVRLVEHLDGAVRHAAGRGWLVCRDGVWCPDKQDKEVRRYAEEALRKIPEEASLVSDEKVQSAIYKHARVSLGRQGIREAIYLAESNREVCVEEEQLDKDPLLLGVLNGVLDLRDGTLLDEPASALVTKRVLVAWDPASTCPLWEKFLCEVFDGDQELIEFLRRWVGYCLTGETREHKLLVLHGEKSRNGKSTVLETLLRLFGPDYAHGAKPKVISAERGHGEHDTDRNAMRGRRLTVIDEWPRGVGFSEDMIKRATGAETQSGRGIGEDETNFVATTKITIGSNPPIEIIGEDDAVWNRVRYLPFEVSFLGREDKTLGAKLAKELPGILVWAVRGCLEWQQRGLDEPEAVKAHTAAAREDADDLARWAASALDFGASYSASPTELAASWAAWAEGQKLPPKLARRITARTARSAVEVRWTLTSTRGAAGAKVLGVRVRPGSQFALPDQDPGLAESLACLGN